METDGRVVDDANGWLHLGAQNDAIWRYDARPDGGTEPTIVDTTGVEAQSGGRLAGDVEGLTLYAGRSGDLPTSRSSAATEYRHANRLRNAHWHGLEPRSPPAVLSRGRPLHTA